MKYQPPPNGLPAGSLVDVYLRDSGGDNQDRSVASQFVEVQKYFAQNKWVLGEVYKDIAKSGKNTVGRSDFQRMVNDYEQGKRKPDGLCIWDYARFARNAKEAVLYIALIENKNIVIHSLTDSVPDSEYKDLIRLVKHMGNQAEREKTSANVKREMHQLVKQYKAMFGTPPRGMKKEALPPMTNERTGKTRVLHKWVPDDEIAPLVLRAFEMKDQGRPLSDIMIATGLYAQANTYETFFRNKIYMGVLEFGDEVIENYCEPIVPPELWHRVNSKKEEQKRRPGNSIHDPRRIRSTYLLSGLAFCQHCGAALVGHKIENWDYYLCSKRKLSRGQLCNARRISKIELENAVIEAVKENALSLETIVNLQDKVLNELNRSEEEIHKARKLLEVELGEVTKRIYNLVAAISKHGHSDAIMSTLQELENNKKKLETQINEMRKTIDVRRHNKAELKDISKSILDLLNGSDEEKQSVIRMFVTRIIASRDDVNISALVYYLPIKIINPNERDLLGLREVPLRGITDEALIEVFVPARTKYKAKRPS